MLLESKNKLNELFVNHVYIYTLLHLFIDIYCPILHNYLLSIINNYFIERTCDTPDFWKSFETIRVGTSMRFHDPGFWLYPMNNKIFSEFHFRKLLKFKESCMCIWCQQSIYLNFMVRWTLNIVFCRKLTRGSSCDIL